MNKTLVTTNWLFECLFVAASSLALALPAAGAEGTVYFSDSFEQGLGKWSVGGDTWQVTDLFYHSPTHCASDSPSGNYVLNANSIMAMKVQYRINLSNSDQPVLSFWHRIGVWGGDYGYVEISQDNGFNWEILTSFTDTYRSTWSRELVDLSEYKSTSILIRFRLRDDGELFWDDSPKVYRGWDIDDVEIRETDQETLAFPLLDTLDNDLDNWVFGSWEQSAPVGRGQERFMADSIDGFYPWDACSDLILAHPIDLSTSVSPVLRFWHRIGVYAGDYGYVEISQDNGFNWNVLISFTDTYRSTWSREEVDLSAYKSSPILIRFRLRDDGELFWDNTPQVYSGWDIDDLEIREKDQETLAFPLFDDFESGAGNWVTGGDAWQTTQSYSRSSSHCMTDSNQVYYPRDACSDLILAHPIDLSTSLFPVLSFWHRIDVYDGDYGSVEVSEDGGSSWHAIDPNHPELSRFTDVWYADWVPELMDLSAYKSSSILIRFRLRDDGELFWDDTPEVATGWDIDDVEIKNLIPPELNVEMTGLTAAGCPTILSTVIVADMLGNPVIGLPESAFSVFEDGVLQAATVVESNSQTVSASLALDFSGSMGPTAIADLRWAADQFVGLMRPEDRAEIIKFANGIDVSQNYTQDMNALSDAIWREPNVASSQTVLYDAIYQAILDTAAQQGSDSKAVIAMTDGQDNYSEHGATGVIELAKHSGVRVFTIGLGDQVDEDALKAIATLTGGVYYFAPTSADLESIYENIAGTIQNQYIIVYETSACQSDESPNLEHEVKVEVTASQGYGVDTQRFRCPEECSVE